MRRLYLTVYALPLGFTVFLLVCLLLLWCGLVLGVGRLSRRGRRVCRGLLGMLLFLWLAIILHNTVFSRSCGERELCLLPFDTLYRLFFCHGNRELLRTLWMNVLLFVPGGLFLTALLPENCSCGKRALLVMALLTGLSAAIETVQYGFGLGRAEVDDVLCNALGAGVGLLIHLGACRSAEEIHAS